MYPYHGKPFLVLIAGMLSTQTREEQTALAADALFSLADTPPKMRTLSDDEIREAIRPASFYNNKVTYIRGIVDRLAEQDDQVPQDINELMEYGGIGYKVAVLVRAAGHGLSDYICVDTHVDRISKRIGLIEPTLKTAQKIDEALRGVLPRNYWAGWNALMVAHGRTYCVARNPRCDDCPIVEWCEQIGVLNGG